MSISGDGKEKVKRTLDLYARLMDGEIINKSEAALRYGVNERSIQRDIEDVRRFMDDDVERTGIMNTVIYDREVNGYRIEKIYKLKLENSEILAICKILLESRSVTKKEMKTMLHKLVDNCVPESNRKLVYELIKNEEYHYVEPHHKKVFLDKMWDIGKAVRDNYYIEVQYHRLKDKAVVKRKLMPLAIMFSEYYFYLTAFIEDEKVRADFDVLNDSFPTIYRIDRIEKLKVLDEHYYTPYKNRFEEGEFRKRIQFMTGGKLRRIEFWYKGLSVEAVLDRFPTAEIIKEKEGMWLIRAEVFGDGVDTWLRGQGKLIDMA